MDLSNTSGAPGMPSASSAKTLWLISALIAMTFLSAPASKAWARTPSQAPSTSSTDTPTPTAVACPPLLQHTFARLQDEKPQALCQYAGKALLIVNTASFCGFTPQYAGLEALHARYQAQGLVVLGFPSNDFSQESGSNKDIASFCENTFNVKFPMFAKSSVTGRQAHPLFKQLAASGGGLPRWNFHKYVVSRDGRTVTSFGSAVEPDDPRVRRAIENALNSSLAK